MSDPQAAKAPAAEPVPAAGLQADLVPCTLGEFLLYFLRLGALGFGGPVALASAMRRDLVDRRGWLTETEYDSGLAIAAACPGPLAYQLGVYAGYIRQGLAGALAVAVAFGFVPFVLVVAVAALYTRLGDAGALRAVFYGVGPVVVALIVKGCWTLGRRTLRRDATAWTLAVAAAVVTAAVPKTKFRLFMAVASTTAYTFYRSSQPESHPYPSVWATSYSI